MEVSNLAECGQGTIRREVWRQQSKADPKLHDPPQLTPAQPRPTMNICLNRQRFSRTAAASVLLCARCLLPFHARSGHRQGSGSATALPVLLQTLGKLSCTHVVVVGGDTVNTTEQSLPTVTGPPAPLDRPV